MRVGWLRRAGVLFLVPFLVVPALSAEVASKGTAPLQKRVEQLAHGFAGTVGVYAYELETGASVAVNADKLFPLASVYKIPIMVEAFRQVEEGRLSLEERIEISKDHARPGSGLLRHMRPGLNPTLYDLILLMITISDNEATDIVLDRVGAANVTARLRTLGLKDIRVDRPTGELIRDWLALADESFRGLSPTVLASNPQMFEKLTPGKIETANRAFLRDQRDVSTPRAMVDLLVKISRSEAASHNSCEQMLDILRRQQFRTRIPRYLPGVEVAHKTGTIGYTTNDAGIIFAGHHNIALAIFTLKDNNQVTTEEAQQRIGEIARAIYDYFDYQAPASE